MHPLTTRPAIVAPHSPAAWRRLLAAALCLPLALGACAAPPPSAAAQDGGLWPAPQPPVAAPQAWAPEAPRFAALQVRPSFHAPSATSCARPIQTREVPGRPARPLQGRAELRDAPAGAALPAEAPSAASAASADLAKANVAEASRSRPAAEADSAAGFFAPRAPQPRPAPPPADGPVTAGMVDDNAAFAEYLAFRDRTQVPHRARDVRERYLLQVSDAQGRGVADAELLVRSPQGQAAWARTDAAGRAWLHPDAFDPQRAQLYEVTARRAGQQATAYLQRGRKSALELRLDAAPPPARAQLDLVLLVDATGSMADEIHKLKASLRSIVAEVAALPSQPDLCLALVAYRDHGDAFVLRSHDFTNDVGAFQGVLDRLHAAGGGDYPEALNEALHETVQHLAWRGDGTTRMVLLLADAPPHLDRGGPQYDESMVAALGKGIKVFGVGASGLDRQGEYIQRQIAQYTGGRFVFLTYADATRPARGPGRETVHDVRNYSVETLDRLIVRLVREELAPLQAFQGGQSLGYNAGLR